MNNEELSKNFLTDKGNSLFRCYACAKDVSERHLDRHIKGKQHKINLQLLDCIPVNARRYSGHVCNDPLCDPVRFQITGYCRETNSIKL